MFNKRNFIFLAAFLMTVALLFFFSRQKEISSEVTKSVSTPVPPKATPETIQEAKTKTVAASTPKREAKPDTKALEPCFSYWTQQHREKFFDKKNFPNKEIILENQPVENSPQIICNLKVRNGFFAVVLATQLSIEKLIEITEGWLKPSGEELVVFRPDGSPFRKNQVMGFWGALELDQPTTSVKIKNCGAEIGWGVQCPQPP